MNTHILIPIKDIEEGIAHYENLLKDSNNKFATKHQGHCNQLQTLLKNYKHISLDEKGIDEKLKLLYPEVCHNDTIQTVYLWSGRNEGYKQALKDLLL